MKTNKDLYDRMQRAYQRFLKSNLTQAAFCKAEGLSPSQFGYWHKRFSSEATATTTTSTATAPAVSGFTQLSLPSSPATTALTPVMVLDLAGKGRLEFYARVEVDFLKALLT